MDNQKYTHTTDKLRYIRTSIGIVLILLGSLCDVISQTGPDCEMLGIDDPIGFNLTLTSGTATVPGEQFCVEFNTENFNFVSSFQFTFNWDPTIFSYLGAFQNMGALIGPVQFNETRTQEGLLPIIWTNANADGQTLADGRAVFQICFEVIGDPDDCVKLNFNNDLAPFLPDIEVGHNTPDGTCQYDIINLDGSPDSTCVEIACTQVTIIDQGVCNSTPGAAGGTVFFSLCGGTAPYNYNFSRAGTVITSGTITEDYMEESLTNIPTGTYMVDITDADGNMTSSTFEIFSSTAISIIDTTLTLPNCAGASNGVLIIDGIEGGTPDYTVQFSNGITRQNIQEGESVTFDRLGNGDYTVTITDQTGCQEIVPLSIDLTDIEVDIEVIPASCPCANDGYVRVVPRGGTPFAGGEYLINNILSTEIESTSPFYDQNYGFGFWNITIEDANGCQLDPDIGMIEIPTADTIAYEVTDLQNIACRGDSTGNVSVQVTTPGRYQLFASRTPNLFNGCGISPFLDPVPSVTVGNNSLIFTDVTGLLPAGTYYVGIINQDNNCTQELSFTIEEPIEDLIISGTPVADDCGSGGGSAFVTVEEGLGPFTYVWEDDATITDANRTNLAAGTYMVSVQDINGCIRSVEIEVPMGDQLDIEASIVSGLGCDNTGSGELTVTIIENTGGAANFTWFDMNNDVIGTDQNQAFSAAGEYYVEVNNTVCTVRDTVTIDPNSAFTFEIIDVPPGCPDFNNGSITLDNFAGGTAPYTCSWDGGLMGCEQTDLMEGSYTVTITDADNCEVIETITLISTDVSLTFDINAIDPNCGTADSGVIEILNIAGGTAPYTCSWEDPTIMSCNPTGLLDGTYNFTVIDADGCQKDSSITLVRDTVNIIFQVATTNPTCGGGLGSIFINSIDGPNPPFNVQWIDTLALGSTLTDLDAGDYTARITDGAGCNIDTTITLINEADNFVLDIDFTVPQCPNGTDGAITLINCINCSCDWGDPVLNAQGCNLVSLAPALYNLVVTDSIGCQKDTFVDLRVNDALEISLSQQEDASCFEGMDGTALVEVIADPRGVGVYDFFWSNGEVTSGVMSANIMNLPVGENFVVGFDGTCTSDTLFFDIAAPTQVALDIPNVTTEMTSCSNSCDGQANLAAMGGTSTGGNYSYLWEDGTNAASRDDLCSGRHYVTIVDDNLCERLDSIEIMSPDSLTIDTISILEISCFVDDSGQIQIEGQGGCGNYTYQWTDNISDNGIADQLTAGTYTVTITDDCGCELIQDFELARSSSMDVTPIVPDIPNCVGQTQCIGIDTVTGGVGSNYTYTVDFITDRLPIDSCVERLPGMYILTVFDEAGCDEMITVVVEDPPAFEVNLGSDFDLDLGDTETTLTAEVIGGTGPFTYEWNADIPINCLDSTSCNEILINPTEFVNIQVLVTDANGCQAFDDISIDVRELRNIYIPNSFNPNDDAPNNRFMVLTGQGVEQLVSFRIYDRWGSLVFDIGAPMDAPTILDDGWDGRKQTSSFTECEQGVYVYVAEVKFLGTVQPVVYRGSITLFR